MSDHKTVQEVVREIWAKDPLDFGSVHFGNIVHRERLSVADMVAIAKEAKRCADARYGQLVRAVKALKKARNDLAWLKIQRPRATEADICLAENAVIEATDDLCALGGYE